MENLKITIMIRDDLTESDWNDLVKVAIDYYEGGADPEEIICDVFGVEPDYIFDLLDIIGW